MGAFYTRGSLPDASFTQRGATSVGAQETQGPKSVRTAYSQDKTYSAVPVTFASIAMDMGFPANWDIGDPNTFGTGDLLPDGLQTMGFTAVSMPDFSYEVLSLGFSLLDPVNNDHSSYFDIDSFTQGGLQVRRQRQGAEYSVETTVRAFGNDGVSNSTVSEVRLSQNSITISTDNLQLPSLNNLTVSSLTVTNINGSPYGGALIQSVTNGAGGKGLQLDNITGDLSYVADASIWTGQGGMKALSGGGVKDTIFSTPIPGISFLTVPLGFPNSWWLLSVNCVLTNANASDELVGVWLSLDGGTTWEYDSTSLPRAYIGANTSAPFNFAFPLALTPGTYDWANILVAFTGSSDVTVNATGTGSFEARIVRLS